MSDSSRAVATDKSLDTHLLLLAVNVAHPLLPCTFEPALHHLLKHEIGQSHVDARCWNDLTGAVEYPRAVLVKDLTFPPRQTMPRTKRKRLRHMSTNAGIMVTSGSRILTRTRTASNIITVNPPADSTSNGRT
jgi:hypothetical protein